MTPRERGWNPPAKGKSPTRGFGCVSRPLTAEAAARRQGQGVRKAEGVQGGQAAGTRPSLVRAARHSSGRRRSRLAVGRRLTGCCGKGGRVVAVIVDLAALPLDSSTRYHVVAHNKVGRLK